MKDITVTVEDEVHRRAYIKATARDASVSTAVREFLIRLSSEETIFERRKRLQIEAFYNIESFRAGDPPSREDAHRRSLD